MEARFAALRTGRALLPKNIIFQLLVVIFVKSFVTPRDLWGRYV
jgi:hypothetical protein